MTEHAEFVSSQNGQAADPLDWHSDGYPLRLKSLPPFVVESIRADDWSVWRYGAMLPVEKRVSLGEGGTPLALAEIDGLRFHAKLEYLNPTGSYKDRGTVTLVNYLAGLGVTEVVEDSSGNAGASLAAYAAAAGIKARIFVPASAPIGKKQLIASFGAELVEIPGPRAAATEAIREAIKTTVYASHAWNPMFITGQMTAAWEVWEQLGRRAPDAIVCAVGHGGLFLGFARGFRALLDAGLISRMPRLYAVQSAACDPLVEAWENGLDHTEPTTQQATVADGIVVTQPVHGREILAVIRETGGAAFRVNDAAILAARTALNQHGLIVEPTSAVPVAALLRERAVIGEDNVIVVPLTGNGLKTLAQTAG